jgi:hypothetical protein
MGEKMNGIMRDDAFDYEQLDPGIRRLVAWLRENGFRTTDSGDGKTKLDAGFTEEDGVSAYPHVAISVAPSKLVREANRLADLLYSVHRVLVCPTPPEPNGDPDLDAFYNVADRRAMMVLMHVDDSKLVGAQVAETEGGGG